MEKNKLKKVNRPSLSTTLYSRLTQHSHPPGHTAEPFRHRQDLRAECHPQAERATESAETRVEDRCRQLEGADGGYDEAGHGEYGECGERDGSGDEGDGFGEGIHTYAVGGVVCCSGTSADLFWRRYRP